MLAPAGGQVCSHCRRAATPPPISTSRPTNGPHWTRHATHGTRVPVMSLEVVPPDAGGDTGASRLLAEPTEAPVSANLGAFSKRRGSVISQRGSFGG